MKRRLSQPPFLWVIAALALWIIRWPLLQYIAWIGMAADYSQEVGLSEGIRMAVSGEHPCAMCAAIDNGIIAESALLSAILQNPSIAIAGVIFLLGAAAVSLVSSKHTTNALN